MIQDSASFRFEVALSFPGEHRDRVENIAKALADRVGKSQVLYDRWLRGEFSRPNLDTYLLTLYRDQSRLLVFFICKDYAEKEWCGLEWRVGRELLKKREDDRLMFLRLDDADVPGLYSIDGCLDIRRMSANDVANEILTRSAMLSSIPSVDIEKMVRDLRAQTRPDLLNRCGTIRILTMEQPLDVGDVYTDVNVLDKRASNLRMTREELIRDASALVFDHSGLSMARSRRLSGLEAVETNHRIMIYGKPGAGKTTFLKRLALECVKGNFRSDLVPVFVTLKDFAESEGSPSLFNYIERQWNDNANCKEILNQGRALVLLDGLDEVRDQDFDRTCRSIENATSEYYRCPIVLTCRIAAREYTFQLFSEVEMADFSPAQIQTFASRWFAASGQDMMAQEFSNRLEANQRLQELASSPLLLTLLCLVFQERSDFYGTRAELYREGLDILLRRWDAKRGIERDRPYGLSITDLEILLGNIAYTRFLHDEYFFEQAGLEEQICGFFEERNLIARGSEFRAERVLNSIESDLGLLVQRAARLYSFSHLTFQEFLTAQRVAKKATLIPEIGVHMGDRRWREVWLLLVTMLDADDIIFAMKHHLDMLPGRTPKLKHILQWCQRKAAQLLPGHKGPLMRALYFELGLSITLGQDLNFSLFSAMSHQPFDVLSHDDPGLKLDLALSKLIAVVRACQDAFINRRSRKAALDLHGGLDRLAQAKLAAAQRVAVHQFADDAELELKSVEIAAAGLAPQLEVEMATLREELPQITQDGWARCLERIRELAISYRDVGHNWNLNDEERRRLNEYSHAILLLVECISVARGLTNTMRGQIENQLLGPALD